jgi:hypothetical protein
MISATVGSLAGGVTLSFPRPLDKIWQKNGYAENKGGMASPHHADAAWPEEIADTEVKLRSGS